MSGERTASMNRQTDREFPMVGGETATMTLKIKVEIVAEAGGGN